MLYPVTAALYDEVLARLTDAIGDTDYFSGTLAFAFGQISCRLRVSVIACRRTERLPEGPCRPIADLVPVWWEFFTESDEGELLNDFSFDEVRKLL